MNKTIRFATPLIAVALMGIAPAFVRAQDSANNTQSQNAPAAVWNTPPAGTEQAQQGYRYGIQALHLNTAAKRKIDAKAAHLYDNPPVKVAGRVASHAS